MISSLTETDTISNVLIYISDSLRFDHLPNELKSRSTYGQAIAASTFTGSGYPSILTGKYPTNHRVWALTETLAEKPQLFQDKFEFGIDATTVWGNMSDPENKPPIRMCHQSNNTTLSDVEPPFILVVHDTGGHMQYGSKERDDWDSHEDFFDDLQGKPDRIVDLYQEGVAESLDRFFRQCERLRSQGEFEDTLIILTSDHGELLGEYGGAYDHGSPITPELVSVPMAFLGAELPTDEEIDPLLSTTDVVPTAFAALGEPLPPSLDGSNLWDGDLMKIKNRVLRSEIWKDPDYPIMSYKSSSAWTSNGGVVCHLDSMHSRLAYLLAYEYYYATYSNIICQPSYQIKKLWKSYLSKKVVYGDPPHEIINSIPQTFYTRQQLDDVSEGPNKRQLRELGYIE